MVSWILSRAVVLVFGTLYPAYYSYKAVKNKNVKEYVRWMMYWIVFAIYTTIETITDLTISWFPLYYEIKIAFVVWLLSPYTRGASLIYRKFLHPLLSAKEQEIDDYIVQAKERSYETMVNFGRQGLSIAATAAVTAAVKGQGAITERLRGFSIPDLPPFPSEDEDAQGHEGYPHPPRMAKIKVVEGSDVGTDDDTGGLFSEEETVAQLGLRRSQSVKTAKPKVLKEQPRYGSLKAKVRRRPALQADSFDS